MKLYDIVNEVNRLEVIQNEVKVSMKEWSKKRTASREEIETHYELMEGYYQEVEEIQKKIIEYFRQFQEKNKELSTAL